MESKEEKLNAYVTSDDAERATMDEIDPTGVLVKPKWRGTSQDKMDMETLGRHQVLRVRQKSCCSVALPLPCNG